MTVIEISDEHAAALRAKAAAQGLTLQAWIAKIVEEELHDGRPAEPFKTGRGLFTKYGPPLSAEEIDENRREIFHNFAQDF